MKIPNGKKKNLVANPKNFFTFDNGNFWPEWKKASDELSTNCLDVNFGIEHFALCIQRVGEFDAVPRLLQEHFKSGLGNPKFVLVKSH